VGVAPGSVASSRKAVNRADRPARCAGSSTRRATARRAAGWPGVNGPNGAENFEDIGIPDGANACPVDGVDRFAAYDTADARYLDDVRAWPSVEPAIDFTATGMLAFALAAAGQAASRKLCT
jgi:hypothetical protein